MPPPQSLPDSISTRLPEGMLARFQAVLRPGETQSAMIRDLIIDLVLERESKAKKRHE